jgi:hypothetical protein
MSEEEYGATRWQDAMNTLGERGLLTSGKFIEWDLLWDLMSATIDESAMFSHEDMVRLHREFSQEFYMLEAHIMERHDLRLRFIEEPPGWILEESYKFWERHSRRG